MSRLQSSYLGRTMLFNLISCAFFCVFSVHHAFGQSNDMGLDVGMASHTFATKSAVRLANSSIMSGALVHVYREVSPGFALGAAWWRPSTNKTGDREFNGHAAIIDARTRYSIWPWLEPFARGGLGVLRQEVAWSNSFSELQSVNWLPLGMLAVGVDVLMPRASWSREKSPSRFAAGMTAEIGWLHTLGRNWVLDGKRDDSAGLPQQSVDLGAATVAGLWAKLSFLVRW